jgi:hypothetical protein
VSNDRAQRSRYQVFAIEIVYLAILALFAWAVLTNQSYPWLANIPKAIVSVPTPVLWFGALGGVLISLTGVHEHRYNWDPEYWSWHVVRPFVGAAVALIAVMIVQAGILATGAPDRASQVATDNTFYYLIAFVAGYREETFRGMIKRVSDVIFTSEGTGGAPTVRMVEPVAGPAAGGELVKVRGAGLSSADSVTFGATQAPHFDVSSDGLLQVTTPAGSGGATVDVTVVTAGGSSTLSGAYTYTDATTEEADTSEGASG